jgi:hypothetical protein
MALDRVELKKLLKEKGVKSLDDFNAFMRDGIRSLRNQRGSPKPPGDEPFTLSFTFNFNIKS